jgi:hypothetical protein
VTAGFGHWAIHKALTPTTYVGRRRFEKPEAEVAEMAVPPIIVAAEFEAVQALLKIRGPAILSGVCFAPFAAWR